MTYGSVLASPPRSCTAKQPLESPFPRSPKGRGRPWFHLEFPHIIFWLKTEVRVQKEWVVREVLSFGSPLFTYMVAWNPGGPRSSGLRGVCGADDSEVKVDTAELGVHVESTGLVYWAWEGGALCDEE